MPACCRALGLCVVIELRRLEEVCETERDLLGWLGLVSCQQRKGNTDLMSYSQLAGTIGCQPAVRDCYCVENISNNERRK